MLRKLSYLLLLTIVPFVSCKDEEEKPTGGDVVINELMALNSSTITDQDGEYEDWVELYNKSENAIDLSGYYLTDNSGYLTKWKFPSGTTIAGKGYLIIWTDDDASQTGLHASFRLSADGEEVLLVSPNQKVLDKVEFGGQSADISYARIPNGTGDFSWGAPTFNASNIR